MWYYFCFFSSRAGFLRRKGFQNEPARCPECRSARKQATGRGPAARPQRELFAAVCSACGVTTQVPFKPTAGKPVYCRACFQTNKNY
ncbi:CxxC-x17-CxxC domain-containing protein [Thermosinus carboxydivorans]|uniref:CxxC-x17-CxxC domain-containing protein n=1 Tax=Thermosinus carboxydivorans TaxID=261685 RepID=UPI0038CD8CD2